MTQYANIVVRTEYNEILGRLELIHVEWEGNASEALVSPAALHHHGVGETLKVGEVFSFGSLQLRVVNVVQGGRSYVVMRNGWRSQLRQRYYPLLRQWRLLPERVRMTLAVWGLREWTPNK